MRWEQLQYSYRVRWWKSFRDSAGHSRWWIMWTIEVSRSEGQADVQALYYLSHWSPIRANTRPTRLGCLDRQTPPKRSPQPRRPLSVVTVYSISVSTIDTFGPYGFCSPSALILKVSTVLHLRFLKPNSYWHPWLKRYRFLHMEGCPLLLPSSLVLSSSLPTGWVWSLTATCYMWV